MILQAIEDKENPSHALKQLWKLLMNTRFDHLKWRQYKVLDFQGAFTPVNLYCESELWGILMNSDSKPLKCYGEMKITILSKEERLNDIALIQYKITADDRNKPSNIKTLLSDHDNFFKI